MDKKDNRGSEREPEGNRFDYEELVNEPAEDQDYEEYREEDDFDEEKGKRIAESKATFKAHELVSRLLEEALQINTAKLERLYRDNAISQSIVAIREYEHLKTLKL